MATSIRPLHDRVLLRPVAKQKMSAGGIDLSMANTPADPNVIAEVMAVGPKVTEVTVGENVILPLHTGTKTVDGQLLVKEIDLLGVLEPTL